MHAYIFVLFNIALMLNYLSDRIVRRIFLLIDVLVNISMKRFMRAYTFVLFLSALWRPIGGAVIRQNLSIHVF